jgi:phospholipid/cholesterol/gamma-HCH transport system substrate-binding protein
MQFRVGVMIFATLLITLILVVMFGKLPQIHGRYVIYVKFLEAPGVSDGTPIRKSGIRIGKVARVEFTDDDQVLVTAEIDADRTLRHDEVCRVKTTVLGDSSLQFDLSRDPRRPKTPIERGETVQGSAQPGAMDVVADLQGSFAEAITSITKTSDEAGSAMRRINKLVASNEENIQRVIVQLDKTLQSTQSLMDFGNEVIGDKQTREKFKQAISSMPTLVEDAHKTIDGLQNTMALIDKNLKNLEGFTQPLGEHGGAIMARLDQQTKRLDGIMTELHDFSRSLNSSEGTLGQLVKNPELYQHLNRAAKNVDELTREMKPILNDARALTDKVSRHPGVIVRDAIKPGAGIK